MPNSQLSFLQKLKQIFIGDARNISDKSTFHKISLITFFAWVGLGADGLTSSCYGPEEAFRNLSSHTGLAIFVAIATAFTIFIISTSYSQIIKLFPHGGGGYIVASKLISPTVGMVSGCSLLIDYVLTITLSISSGADALFSFLPLGMIDYKLLVAVLALLLLIIMNLRGVRESVMSLTPIFVVFVVMHVFVVCYVLITHGSNMGVVAADTSIEIHSSVSQLGILGTLFIILRAYSMGAGTFTGIEAVSNGIPILREPRAKTARRTMVLMATSLAFVVVGLMIAYSLYHVQFEEGKTLNAVLFSRMSMNWNPGAAKSFILITLASEAALLFVAAQTGFLDGPRIMANMASDSWFPKKFASLSDRLVTQNGVLLMGIAALVLLIVSKGSVQFLVVLYSINVFITFSLSQLGMVRHWWAERKREKGWLYKLFINGIGLTLTTFILMSVVIIKFTEGGWITILITGILVALAISIKRHYYQVALKLQKLQLDIFEKIQANIHKLTEGRNLCHQVKENAHAKTAVILVGGYTGTGIHTLFNIINSFKGLYKNYIFVQVGIVDAQNFKGSEEIDKLKNQVNTDLQRYVDIVNELGYFGRSYWTVDTDVPSAMEEIIPQVQKEYSDTTLFGGQLIFSQSYYISKLLHNHTIFQVQRRLYKRGLTTIIMPIYIE